MAVVLNQFQPGEPQDEEDDEEAKLRAATDEYLEMLAENFVDNPVVVRCVRDVQSAIERLDHWIN